MNCKVSGHGKNKWDRKAGEFRHETTKVEIMGKAQERLEVVPETSPAALGWQLRRQSWVLASLVFSAVDFCSH